MTGTMDTMETTGMMGMTVTTDMVTTAITGKLSVNAQAAPEAFGAALVRFVTESNRRRQKRKALSNRQSEIGNHRFKLRQGNS
jgi:hypothetical protein